MSVENNKLDLPHWSKLDNSTKFLFIFVFCITQTLLYQMIIYYHFIAETNTSMGLGIMLSGIGFVLVMRKLQK